MGKFNDYISARTAEEQRQYADAKRAKDRNAAVDAALAELPDETALEVIGAFRCWEADIDVGVGERLQYADKLYKVIQAHHTQADWTPDTTPALFTKIAKPGEIPVWKQPTGAQDAYMAGDKVHYPGKDDPVWVSEVDNNVWEPGVYGWSRE